MPERSQGKRRLFPKRFGREELSEEKKYREMRMNEPEIGQESKVKSAKSREKILKARQEAVTARDVMLADAEDFPRNQRLEAVRLYIDRARDVVATRKAVRAANGPQEKAKWTKKFAEAKRKFDEMMDDPAEFPKLEKAFRAWIVAKKQYGEFRRKELELAKINVALDQPTVRASAEENFSVTNIARLERLSGEEQEIEHSVDDDIAALDLLYEGVDGGDEQIELLSTELRGGERKELEYTEMSRAELEKLRGKLERELDTMWQEDIFLQRLEAEHQTNRLLEDLVSGKDVLALPSVIQFENQLAEWERLHARTTVGAIVVGEPGVGKTTGIRDYLEKRGRKYVYIDLSEEVTRYTLFGTKALEFKSSAEYYEELLRQLEGMDEVELKKFIVEHGKTIAKTYRLKGEESEGEALFFQMLQEELSAAAEVPDLKDKIDDAKARLTAVTQEAFRGEVANRFLHLVQKNGWRDGVIISALRRRQSVIFDEFVKCRDLTLIYGLLTAKPGGKWHFADNNEDIEVPSDWRMYFTANIGRKHGGYKVAEALASRGQGKIVEAEYPPRHEETTVALASLCDAEGYFLRREEDRAKMMVFVNDVIPKIRVELEGKEGVIPISWRTIRDLGEKLVEQRTIDGQIVRRATSKSFDEGAWEILVDSYKLYEDRSMARNIVDLMTQFGFFVDDEWKRKVVPHYLPEDEFTKRREKRDENIPSFDALVKKMLEERTMQRAFMTEERPVRSTQP